MALEKSERAEYQAGTYEDEQRYGNRAVHGFPGFDHLDLTYRVTIENRPGLILPRIRYYFNIIGVNAFLKGTHTVCVTGSSYGLK